MALHCSTATVAGIHYPHKMCPAIPSEALLFKIPVILRSATQLSIKPPLPSISLFTWTKKKADTSQTNFNSTTTHNHVVQLSGEEMGETAKDREIKLLSFFSQARAPVFINWLLQAKISCRLHSVSWDSYHVANGMHNRLEKPWHHSHCLRPDSSLPTRQHQIAQHRWVHRCEAIYRCLTDTAIVYFPGRLFISSSIDTILSHQFTALGWHWLQLYGWALSTIQLLHYTIFVFSPMNNRKNFQFTFTPIQSVVMDVFTKVAAGICKVRTPKGTMRRALDWHSSARLASSFRLSGKLTRPSI